MAITDAQYDLLFRYFDGDLTDFEENQLMVLLQHNIELQEVFDLQIMLSDFLRQESTAQKETLFTESSDAFLSRVTNALETKQRKKSPILPIALKLKWSAAAALIAIILTTAIHIGLVQKNSHYAETKIDTNRNRPAPIIEQPDTMIDSQQSLESLYQEYYTPLPKGSLEWLADASPFEFDYYNHQYKKLASEKEDVLVTKGQYASNKNDVALYFLFYKALSNIEINKHKTARQILEELLPRSKHNIQLYNQVCWYLLMAQLKLNDKQNAIAVSQSISVQKENPYNNKAIQITTKLTTKN